MNAVDIERTLALLGEQLQELGLTQPIHLLMIGGAFMITQIGNREATRDIDVSMVGREQIYTTDVYRIFRNAVHFVGYDAGVGEGWLSDNIGDLLTNAGPVPKGRRWRSFGPLLHVYVPSKAYILALKIFAGRDRDEEDIHALCALLDIKTRKQAKRLVDRYITNRDLQVSEQVEKKLTKFFGPP
jgi:hypothetical protein